MTWQHERGKLNALQRHRDPDDPAIADTRRELAVARAADYITKLVSTAPPLTDRQRSDLACLLLRGDAA